MALYTQCYPIKLYELIDITVSIATFLKFQKLLLKPSNYCVDFGLHNAISIFLSLMA
jgi:hypothetical protein